MYLFVFKVPVFCSSFVFDATLFDSFCVLVCGYLSPKNLFSYIKCHFDEMTMTQWLTFLLSPPDRFVRSSHIPIPTTAENALIKKSKICRNFFLQRWRCSALTHPTPPASIRRTNMTSVVQCLKQKNCIEIGTLLSSVHTGAFLSSLHYILHIFDYLKRNNLLRKTDQWERGFILEAVKERYVL